MSFGGCVSSRLLVFCQNPHINKTNIGSVPSHSFSVLNKEPAVGFLIICICYLVLASSSCVLAWSYWINNPSQPVFSAAFIALYVSFESSADGTADTALVSLLLPRHLEMPLIRCSPDLNLRAESMREPMQQKGNDVKLNARKKDKPEVCF